MAGNAPGASGGGADVCSKCGKPNRDQANFCAHCGARMSLAQDTPFTTQALTGTVLPANYLPANARRSQQRATSMGPEYGLHGKNKIVGLLLTFFFPFFGFLYSTNYIWAVFALIIDLINLFLVAIFGLGLLTGLLWRLLALIISNNGIDRYRLRRLQR